MAEVKFTDQAMNQCLRYQRRTGRQLILLIEQVLGQDPRPAYLRESSGRRHGTALWDLNVVWEYTNQHFLVKELEPLKLDVKTVEGNG
nr:hypothetical protein [Thalassotalea sp. G20_0]